MSLSKKTAGAAVVSSRELTIDEVTRVGGALSAYDSYGDYGDYGGGGGGYYDFGYSDYGYSDYGFSGYYSDISDYAYSDYTSGYYYYDISDFAYSDYTSGYFSSPDYCTGVPDAPFGYYVGPACETHDGNYALDTTMTRYEADMKFLADMQGICADQYNNGALCTGTAAFYFMGVRVFGGFFYEGPVETAWDSPTYYNP